jgi:hypothetical protein
MNGLIPKLHLPIPAIAMVCHQTIKAYNDQIDDETLDWKDCGESTIKGVEWRLTHMDAPASAQHEAWMEDKYADGWVHGPSKNAVTKEHPCLVPYDELPPEQRIKDALFIAIVTTFVDADLTTASR